MTIIEILVALTIFGVISYLVATILGRSVQITARESALLELEQTCHFTVDKVEAALQKGALASISVLNDPAGGLHAFSVNPIEGITAEGELAWKGSNTIYYWNAEEHTLYKTKFPPGPDDSQPVRAAPNRLTSSELMEVISASDNQAVTVTEGVTGFQVTKSPPTESERLFNISITLERNIGETKLREFTLEKEVALRN